MPPTNNTVELRLRAAVDAAPSGLLMTDAEGRIVLANRQVEELFGYSREELLGKPVEFLIPERLRAGHAEHRAQFLRTPRVRVMGAGRELFGLRKDGREVPLEIALTPVVSDDGIFVLSAIVDLTARRSAEERFRIAVEASPSGMLMIDKDGRILLVNREIERMFGYAREELAGQPVEILVPQGFRAGHVGDRDEFLARPFARAMGTGRDLFGARKDGVEIPLEIGLNPIVTDSGPIVLASVVDISARKRAEQENRRLEAQFRQAQKLEAIGRLASGIAHDFNNVLMGIIGCGALAKRTLESGHAAAPLIDDICDAAKRGASLSRDLLSYSRPKPIEVLPVELNSVVNTAVRMLRPMIGADIALDVQLCRSGGPMLGNPTHLEHVLLNLVVNARDAMPRGGRLRIATRDLELLAPLPTRGRVLAPGHVVALEVEDTGTGMPPATQEQLFEPFFTTKELGAGTGLGLYTVYSIVNQLQGGIDVESAPGRGTRFSLYFPRTTELADVPIPPAPTKLSADPRKHARILVVEDELLIRVTLRHLLKEMGHQVVVAEHAAAAVAAARAFEGKLDLLLSDMVLPDASGAELAELLKQERPDMAVLFMSAYPTELLVKQGRVAKGTRTLEKPFDEEDLAEAVQRALQPVGAPERGSPEHGSP